MTPPRDVVSSPGRAAALYLAALVAACAGGDEPLPTAPTIVRLAEVDRIDEARTDASDILSGAVAPEHGLAPDRSLTGADPWRYFRTRNELGEGPLAGGVPTGPPARLASEERGIPVPPGFGAAISFDLEQRSPILIRARGTFGPVSDLTALVIAMDDRAPRVPERIVPGSLRARIREHGLGSPRALAHEAGGERARLLFSPPPGARSLTVLLASSGSRHERVEAVEVFALSPIRRLAAAGSVGEGLVGSVEVHRVRMPSIVLDPTASVRTREIEPPQDAVLSFDVAWVGAGPAPSLRVRAVSPGGDVEARTVALDSDPRWTHRVLAFEALSSPRVRFEFELVGGGRSGFDAGIACVGSPLLVPREGQPARPDVVLISIDTLRRDRLGCYGARPSRTPHLDALAQAGVRFENAFAPAPWTLPSHVSMFSGLAPEAHGVQSNRARIPQDLPLVSEALQDLGYRTAAFTAGGYLAAAFGHARGFDAYCEIDPVGDEYYPGHMTGGARFPNGDAGSLERALEWLARERGVPSYLLLHTFIVHSYLPPKDLAVRAGLADPDDPPLTFEAARRFEPERVLAHPLDDEDRERLVAAYEATVEAADRMIGRVVGHLRKRGRLGSTVIVATSDHGQELLDRGGTGHGITLYDEILRVPLIVRAPGARAGVVVGARVGLSDIAPSILDLARGETAGARSGGLDASRGRSFAPALFGLDLTDRPILATVRDPNRSIRSAIVDRGYKLIVSEFWSRLPFRPLAEVELYDLDEDPGERRNLADVRGRELAAMRERLDSALDACGRLRAGLAEGGSASLGAELEQVLRQMGYLGGER